MGKPIGKTSRQEIQNVDRLLKAYESQVERVDLFRNQLFSALNDSTELSPHVHSMKSRLKDPEHLRDKLLRKLQESKNAGETFDITAENLLVRINDLAGIRIMHLYTRQIREIDKALRTILNEQQYSLREGPFARTWDDESRDFFQECGIETQPSKTMYTSVHYIVGSASRTVITCEIQVRTLMEEVWGEVEHTLNYPHETDVLACKEQLKVLARVTSSATRLVDSIFLTFEEAQGAARAAKPRAAGQPAKGVKTNATARPKAGRRRATERE